MYRTRIVEIEERVNKKNTKLWFMMNENSRAPLHRQQFVTENGGLFYQNDRGDWMWKNDFIVKNGYWLRKRETGKEVFFENMSEFCRLHDLSIVKICEVMNGKRKSYKDWEAVEVRPVKDGPGGKKNVGENPENRPKFETVTQTAIFKNWKTNEIVLVTNIPQFAAKINGQEKELYQVARGQKKFYKEWTLATSTTPPTCMLPKKAPKKES